MTNGQPLPQSPPQPAGGGEPVSYEDVMEYYRELTNNLHAQLAIARGQIANRDRVIEQLRSIRPAGGFPSEPEPVSYKESP